MKTQTTRKSIAKSISGKSFRKSIKEPFKKELGTKSSIELKREMAKSLGGKNKIERERIYKKIGLKKTGREKLEEIISPNKTDIKREPTLMEKRAMRKMVEAKKIRNINALRRSEEELGGGLTRVASSSSFAGGKTVTSKTLTREVAKGVDAGSGTMSKLSGASGFAKSNNISNNNTSSKKGLGSSSPRPLGF